MKTSTQEMVTLLFVLTVACIVFWETREFGAVSAGQTSPGGFPRLAAGTMGLLAVIRAALLLSGATETSQASENAWGWISISRPLGAAVLLAVYVALFGKVHFAILTGAFVLSIFFVFGVRPLLRLLIGAALSSAFLYVLFVYLLKIAV